MQSCEGCVERYTTSENCKINVYVQNKRNYQVFLFRESYTKEPNYKCCLGMYDLIIRNTILKLAKT